MKTDSYFGIRNPPLRHVLQDGQITEAGTHQELLRKQGYYWQTYVLQYGLQGEEAAKHGA